MASSEGDADRAQRSEITCPYCESDKIEEPSVLASDYHCGYCGRVFDSDEVGDLTQGEKRSEPAGCMACNRPGRRLSDGTGKFDFDDGVERVCREPNGDIVVHHTNGVLM